MSFFVAAYGDEESFVKCWECSVYALSLRFFAYAQNDTKRYFIDRHPRSSVAAGVLMQVCTAFVAETAGGRHLCSTGTADLTIRLWLGYSCWE